MHRTAAPKSCKSAAPLWAVTSTAGPDLPEPKPVQLAGAVTEPALALRPADPNVRHRARGQYSSQQETRLIGIPSLRLESMARAKP